MKIVFYLIAFPLSIWFFGMFAKHGVIETLKKMKETYE